MPTARGHLSSDHRSWVHWVIDECDAYLINEEHDLQRASWERFENRASRSVRNNFFMLPTKVLSIM